MQFLKFFTLNPDRAPELFKYIYTIRTVAATYVWDNMSNYDITFRELVELHPYKNWGVKYMQGWQIFLKDKIEKVRHFSNFQHKCNENKKGGDKEFVRSLITESVHMAITADFSIHSSTF